MNAFRYQAVAANGTPAQGVIEAEDRKAALRVLQQRGIYPSLLEPQGGGAAAAARPAAGNPAATAPAAAPVRRFGTGIKRKEITALTREMAALLGAAIPIPQALEGLAEGEENPVLRTVVGQLSESVRKGASFSAALEEHPRLFGKLYSSMVRVGEEAGVLPKVMTDLAQLLEHEDEMRSEVVSAVAYPAFVLGFGILTVTILMTVVLPKLFGMLQDMLTVLPLPTRILLAVSGGLQSYWPYLLVLLAASGFGLRAYLITAEGARRADQVKMRIPLMGAMFRAAALSRFARTLGTLVKSGVSLLPALKIVENTIGK